MFPTLTMDNNANTASSQPKKPQRIVESLHQAAAQGDAEAQFSLGFLYANGLGELPQDLKRAAALWQQAAAQGDADAQYELGRMHFDGQGGLPKDALLAAALWQQAAAQGHAEALCELGCKYFNGQGGLPQNRQRARELWQQAAAQGHLQTLCEVGCKYFSGQGGLPKDASLARELWQQVAAQGRHTQLTAHQVRSYPFGSDGGYDKVYTQLAAIVGKQGSEALFLLGEIYFDGQGGLPKNLQRAATLWGMAAAQGHDEAHIKLGLMCFNELDLEVFNADIDIEALLRGEEKMCGKYGTPKRAMNIVENYVAELRAGAAQGDAEAQYKLGRLHMGHLFSFHDEQLGMDLLRQAAAQGNAEIQLKVGLVLSDENLVNQALKQGGAEIQFKLAQRYCYHNNDDNGRKRAEELWLQAAEQGHADARAELSFRFSNLSGNITKVGNPHKTGNPHLLEKLSQKRVWRLFLQVPERNDKDEQPSLWEEFAGLFESSEMRAWTPMQKRVWKLLQQAAEQGDAEAQHELFDHFYRNYLNGGEPKHLRRAAALFQQAAAQGHPWTRDYLYDCVEGIYFAWGDRSAAAVDNIYDLGKTDLSRKYLPQAAEHFQQAAALGHPGARDCLHGNVESHYDKARDDESLGAGWWLGRRSGYKYEGDEGRCMRDLLESLPKDAQLAIVKDALLAHAEELAVLAKARSEGGAFRCGYLPKDLSTNVLYLLAVQGHASSLEHLRREYASWQQAEGALPKDLERATKPWQQAAGQGNAQACFELGKMYFRDVRGFKFPERALALWHQAAAHGHAEAQFELGKMYFNGEGLLKKHLSRATELFQQAAAQGHAEAQFELGKMYFNGQGVDKDAQRAAALFQQAAAQGHAGAQFELGKVYFNGQGGVFFPQDKRRALALWQQAIAQGHAEVQFELGCMYFNGQGMPKDAQLAAKLWELAAAQDHAGAKLQLGEMYFTGEGVPKDVQRAAAIWQQFAKQGHADAQWKLGCLYFNGEGVPKDVQRAAKLWHQAAMQEHSGPKFFIGKEMENAARGGDAEAQFRLGWLNFFVLYSDLCFLNDNYLHWYTLYAHPNDQLWRQAAAQGHTGPKRFIEQLHMDAARGDADAQFHLARMYLYGWCGLNNVGRGLELLHQAGDQGHAEALYGIYSFYWCAGGASAHLLTYSRYAEENVRRAWASELRQLAERGDAQAKAMLEKGDIPAKRYAECDEQKRARAQLRRLAEQGDAEAERLLGAITKHLFSAMR